MVTLVTRGTIVTIVTTVTRGTTVAKVAQFGIVALVAIFARFARFARGAIQTVIAIPTTDICFILLFKIGMFSGEIFAYAVNLFVCSFQKILVGFKYFCLHFVFLFFLVIQIIIEMFLFPFYKILKFLQGQLVEPSRLF